jgi:hypothetical protein
MYWSSEYTECKVDFLSCSKSINPRPGSFLNQSHPSFPFSMKLVQGDQKFPVHLMITIQKVKVMFKVSPASLQTFIDTPNYTRLPLTPSVTPNSNYVIMVSDWNCLKYFCVFFLYCNHQVHRDFLITLYNDHTKLWYRPDSVKTRL